MSRLVVVLVVAALAAAGCGEPGTELRDGPVTIEDHFSGDGGVRLFFKVVPGPGSTVVVVHGGPGVDSAYLEADLAPLARSHTVVYYDQRGSGRSALPGDEALLSIEHHVGDLEMLRRRLDLEKLTLLGHSYGPLLAAHYAIAHPDRVERMIFIGPLPPRQADVWARYQAAMDARLTEEERALMAASWQDLLEGENPVGACRRFWSIALKPRLAEGANPEVVKGDLCSASPEAIRYGMATTNPATMASIGDWDLRAALVEVPAPTLVIHGEQDTIPMDLVEEWTTSLPRARLLRVPGAGHFPYVERPDLVWPEIEGFLEQ